MPTSSVSTVPIELETFVSRPLRRPAKSIGQPALPKSQTSVTAFPDISNTSDIPLSDSVSQQYKSKPSFSSDKVLCFNYVSNASTANSSTTTDSQNYTQFLCNKSNVSMQQVPNVNRGNMSILVTTKVNKNISNETTEANIEGKWNATTESDISTDLIANGTLTTVIVTKEFVSAKISNTENISATPRLSAVSITGISFGVIVFAAFVVVTSFVLYRRRYLNKPQTLNDKCSNPDSSGYIDDSTMRVNYHLFITAFSFVHL